MAFANQCRTHDSYQGRIHAWRNCRLIHSPSGAGLGCRSLASPFSGILIFLRFEFLGFGFPTVLNFGSRAIGLTRRAGQAGDPSLRLKNGYAQDDAVV